MVKNSFKMFSVTRIGIFALFILWFSVLCANIQINMFQGYNIQTTLFGVALNCFAGIAILKLIPEKNLVNFILKKEYRNKKW